MRHIGLCILRVLFTNLSINTKINTRINKNVLSYYRGGNLFFKKINEQSSFSFFKLHLKVILDKDEFHWL